MLRLASAAVTPPNFTPTHASALSPNKDTTTTTTNNNIKLIDTGCIHHPPIPTPPPPCPVTPSHRVTTAIRALRETNDELKMLTQILNKTRTPINSSPSPSSLALTTYASSLHQSIPFTLASGAELDNVVQQLAKWSASSPANNSSARHQNVTHANHLSDTAIKSPPAKLGSYTQTPTMNATIPRSPTNITTNTNHHSPPHSTSTIANPMPKTSHTIETHAGHITFETTRESSNFFTPVPSTRPSLTKIHSIPSDIPMRASPVPSSSPLVSPSLPSSAPSSTQSSSPAWGFSPIREMEPSNSTAPTICQSSPAAAASPLHPTMSYYAHPVSLSNTQHASLILPQPSPSPTPASSGAGLLTRRHTNPFEPTLMTNIDSPSYRYRPSNDNANKNDAVYSSPAVTTRTRDELESKYNARLAIERRADERREEQEYQQRSRVDTDEWQRNLHIQPSISPRMALAQAVYTSRTAADAHNNPSPIHPSSPSKSASVTSPTSSNSSPTHRHRRAVDNLDNRSLAGLNSILSRYSDLPIDVGSRIVPSDGTDAIDGQEANEVEVETILRIGGVEIGHSRAKGTTYDQAEQLGLMAIIEQCQLSLERFEAERLSGPYFAPSSEYDDRTFPLTPTRPFPTSLIHSTTSYSDLPLSHATYAPDETSREYDHPYFGLIPPPIAAAQHTKLDVASLTTNAIFARDHRTEHVPSLRTYYDRSARNGGHTRAQLDLGAWDDDPRHRLQAYLYHRSHGAFAPISDVVQSLPSNRATADGHVALQDAFVAHPTPVHLRTCRLMARQLYDPRSGATPRRQLFHHFLAMRARAYANIASEVHTLRRHARSTDSVDYDHDALTEEEKRAHALDRGAGWANVAEAREWLKREKYYDNNIKAPTMGEANEMIRSALATTKKSTKRNNVQGEPRLSRTKIASHPHQSSDGWRHYSWHWAMLQDAERDAENKLANGESSSASRSHSHSHCTAAMVAANFYANLSPHQPALDSNCSIGSVLSRPTFTFRSVSSPISPSHCHQSAVGSSFTFHDPLPTRTDLPIGEWSKQHVIHSTLVPIPMPMPALTSSPSASTPLTAP